MPLPYAIHRRTSDGRLSSLQNRLLAIAVLFCLFTIPAVAQISTIGNDYVKAKVETGLRTGRFWIEGPATNGGYARLLYHGNQSATEITSNVIFKITTRKGIDTFFCNTPNNFGLGGVRPSFGSIEATFLPYDKVSVSGDTIAMTWSNMMEYKIVMRLIAEKRRTIYDDGADILIEFSFERGPFANVRNLGIMLMLDGDNGDNAVGTIDRTGDQSSILTSDGFFSSSSNGVLFQPGYRELPEFYHIGYFDYIDPVNRLLAVHRIQGVSGGGVPLTPPDRLGVGTWPTYRRVAWNPGGTSNVGDVATGVQWDSLEHRHGERTPEGGIKGMVRTAFGANNRSGNNLYHCRNKEVFVDIRTVRLVEQDVENGPYSPAEFDVEMWVSNLSEWQVRRPSVRIQTPITTFPAGTERLKLDSSTPESYTFSLLPKQTQKLRWRLKVNELSTDTLARLLFLYKKDDTSEYVNFLDDCAPLITIKGFFKPPVDTLPPVINRQGNGRQGTAFWNFGTFDRHPNFEYDTGLDEITILQNDGSNFRLMQTPSPFTRCDVTETVQLRAEVIDTASWGRIVFSVTDCRGNVSLDSAIYRPRPDWFAPTVSKRDSTGAFSALYPCNTRIYEVTLTDSVNQRPDAGDHGFGSVELVRSFNFQPLEIIDQRGGSNVQDFDRHVTLRLQVEDPLLDATAEVMVKDYAGNDTTLFFYYCTIPDTKAPVVTNRALNDTTWRVSASDSLPWDRGLYEAVVVSNKGSNFVFVWPDGSRRLEPPPINKGSKAANIVVEVRNKCDAAELILEYRDIWYLDEPIGHNTFDTIRYAGIPDRLRPNIIITRNVIVPDAIVYDIVVNDIHFINGELFECDRGLERVTFTLTSNMRVRTPLTFSGPMRAQFQIEIIDTLEVGDNDTICVYAIDSAGNANSDCAFWPNPPDGKSPIFFGRLLPDRSAIEGKATDNRLYDRGMGSVRLEFTDNLDPTFAENDLKGIPEKDVTIQVTDPSKPIAGELVIKDLVGELLSVNPEQDIHTVRMPFYLPVVELSVEMPEVVEGGSAFTVSLIAQSEFSSVQAQTLRFDLQQSGDVELQGSSPGAVATMSVLKAGQDLLRVEFVTSEGYDYKPGDVLGEINFLAASHSEVARFTLTNVPGSNLANEGQDTVIIIRKVQQDPLASELTLPPPLFRISVPSSTYINGECERILSSVETGGKANGLAILSVRPQPVSAASTGSIALIIRDLPENQATAEIVASDGTVIKSLLIESDGERVSSVHFPIPTNIVSGAYFLRVRGATGEDVVKIMIAE